MLVRVVSRRERKAHRRAVAGYAIALGPNAPAMRLDDVLGNRQAQSGPAAGARSVAAKEALENARQVFAWDARTIVGDLDHNLAVEPARAHPNVSFRRRELDRIVQQVAERTAHQLGVGQRGQSGRYFHGHPLALARRLRGKALDRGGDESLDVRGHEPHRRAPRLDLRQIEQFLRDLLKRLDLDLYLAQLAGRLAQIARRGVEQTFEHQPDRGERRSQFVRNVRDEIAPGAAQPLQFGYVAQRQRRAALERRRANAKRATRDGDDAIQLVARAARRSAVSERVRRQLIKLGRARQRDQAAPHPFFACLKQSSRPRRRVRHLQILVDDDDDFQHGQAQRIQLRFGARCAQGLRIALALELRLSQV